MKNILLNAYAVSPNWGSEPGMGWNWIINLAIYCKVFVITEGEWRKEIEKAIELLPQKNNIHFYYNPIPDKVRKMCWNQGDWRFYYYYRKWQKKTLKIAQEIIVENKIDVIHQLNMIGFREPGYLWKIKNIPYVWGPIGGMGNIPVAYLMGTDWKQQLFCRLKNTISDLQVKYSPRVKKALNRGITIAATKEVQDKIKKVYNKDIPLINETGCYPKELKKIIKKDNNDTFKILWVGKFDFRKQFNLAVKSISKLANKDQLEFNVIAPFSSETQKMTIENLIKDYKIEKITKLWGKIPNLKVQEMMRESDILFFTSISEGTPHVVLEALQNNLPVVCFDTCGQGDIVNSEIGIKIPLYYPEKSAKDFAKTIEFLKNNRDFLTVLKNGCYDSQKELSWDSKAKQMSEIYSKFLK